MKKNSLLISIICILLTLLFNVTGVRATTGRPGASGNGTGMSAPGSSSICPNWTTTSTLCVYNNKNHASVRFTLMRYDPSKSGNNKYTQVGKSVYFMSNTSYSIDEVKYLDKNGNVKTDKNIVSEKRLINGKDPDSGKIWYASGHNINPDGIQSHFVTKNGHLSQNSLDLFQRMKIKKSENFPVPKDDKISELSAFLINEVAGQECSVSFGSDGSSEEKCKDIKRRYRIVVEPVYSFWTGPKDNKIVYYTAKAIAASGKDLTNGDRWCEIANLLYLEKKDDKFGGFTAGKSYGSSTTCNQGGTHDNLTGNAKSSRNALKKFKNGQGYNIIKFWDDDDIPTPKVCKYNDTDYFKKNRSGSSTPTSKKGSGPNGENCCDLDYIAPNQSKTNLENYIAEYKKLNPGKSMSKSKFKKYFNEIHPECVKPDPPAPVEKVADCNASSETIYDQGAGASTLIASTIQERGTTSVNGSTSKYLRKNVGSYGSISCSEKVTLTLPNKYMNNVYRGSKLEWPTFENSKRSNTYPLTLNGSATCVATIDYSEIVDDNTDPCYSVYKCHCDRWGCSYCCSKKIYWDNVHSDIRNTQSQIKYYSSHPQELYDLKGDFYVNYSDKKYGTKQKLTRYYNGYDNKNYTMDKIKFDDDQSLTSNSFKITQVVKYKIPQNFYRYVVKDNNTGTNISTSNKPTGSNYIDVGYGNLPIADDAAQGEYTYGIQYSNVGGFSNKQFAKNKLVSYTCKYKIDNVQVPTCSCDDPSTANYGKDLTDCLTGGCDNKKYTCLQAKKKFCNIAPCECPEGTKYCGKDLTDYVAKGKTCSQAQAQYCGTDLKACPSGTDFQGQALLTPTCESNYSCKMLKCNVYACPKNTTNSGQKINTLIASYIAKNNVTFSDTVLKKVQNLYCNTSDCDPSKDPDCPGSGPGTTGGDPGNGNGGNNIIYRVIDLEDPFPGKSGDGRDPGFNWDDAETVRNYITNNRRVETNKIYNKNNVMYHFKLTTKTIKEIRKYNKSHDYADFNLTCKAKGGRNCISSFVHNTSYGLQGDSKCYSTGSFSTCKGS